jgi:hypothetical protein
MKPSSGSAFFTRTEWALPFYRAIYFYTLSFTLYILYTCKGEGLPLKLNRELFLFFKKRRAEDGFMKAETW